MEDYQCHAVSDQGQIQGSKFQNFNQQYFPAIKDIKGGKIKLIRVLNSVDGSPKIKITSMTAATTQRWKLKAAVNTQCVDR